MVLYYVVWLGESKNYHRVHRNKKKRNALIFRFCGWRHHFEYLVDVTPSSTYPTESTSFTPNKALSKTSEWTSGRICRNLILKGNQAIKMRYF